MPLKTAAGADAASGERGGVLFPGVARGPQFVALDAAQALVKAHGGGQRDARAVAVPATQGVLAAQVQAVPSEPVGHPVHHALEGQAGLGHAKAPEGPGHGVVGVDAQAPAIHVLHPVGPGGVLHAQFHDLAAQMGVGTGIVPQATDHAPERGRRSWHPAGSASGPRGACNRPGSFPPCPTTS